MLYWINLELTATKDFFADFTSTSVPVDVKSAKKSFVAVSSRLIQYNAWTI